MGNAATRATDYAGGTITTDGLKDMTQGFSVIAYYTGATDCYTSDAWNPKTPNFMYNQQVTYNTTNTFWTYTPVKFWPNEYGDRYGSVDASQGTNEKTDATNDAATANGGKVSFFAYAPYTAVPSYSATPATDLGKTSAFATTAITDGTGTKGVVAITSNAYNAQPEVKYVLGSSASSITGKAVDLLWGMRAKNTTYNLSNGNTDTQASSGDIYNTDLTKQTVEETIDFQFKHALAKIGGHTAESTTNAGDQQTGLQIILDLDNGSKDGSIEQSTAITGGTKESKTLVTVNSITIQDLATYNTNNSSGQRTGDGYLQNVGWFNIATGTWNSVTYDSSIGSAAYTSTVSGTSTEGEAGRLNADIAEQTVSAENQLSYSENKWKFGTKEIAGVVETTPKDVYTAASTAPGILLIPSNNDQTFVVTITYTVRTYDDHLATTTNETTNTKVVQTITNQVTIPGGSLAPNKYYKLLIHLGLTSVKFSATVSDWTLPGDTDENGTIDGGETEDKEHIWLPSNTLMTTSTTVAAGSTSSVMVAASATSYTINLTGLTDGNTVAVSGTNNYNGTGTNVAYTSGGAVQSDGLATATIGLTANNTTSPVDNVITLTEKNSSSETVSTTKVTITQSAK